MTRDRIINFLQQASYMLANVNKANEGLNEARAGKEMLEAQQERQKALEVAKHIADMAGQIAQLEQAIQAKCRVDSLERCETLLSDISERLKIADSAHNEWRQLLAGLDVQARGDMTPEARAAYEAPIAEAKQRSEHALASAGDLVPSPGVVLL